MIHLEKRSVPKDEISDTESCFCSSPIIQDHVQSPAAGILFCVASWLRPNDYLQKELAA
jgi:hypothetical protein